jgi:hypothetical protein
LRFENLESRVVLSGIPDASGVMVDPVAERVPAEQVTQPVEAIGDVELTVDATARRDNVHQSNDGIVHVLAPDDSSAVVVRQFINYRLQPVVEVELAGSWQSFAADSVSEVQVRSRGATPQVEVTEGVTTPVVEIEADDVDEVFGADDTDILSPSSGESVSPLAEDVADGLLATVIDRPATFSARTDSDAEGEEPPGGGGDPLLPPTITEFEGLQEIDVWLFNGFVLDDKDVDGLTVTFGGVLDGETAEVDAEGYFELVVQLPVGSRGVVTAHTVDRDDLGSNTAKYYLS